MSRAIGTTIIISPLDMAGQPGACIVTAILQTGFASVNTDAYGLVDHTCDLDDRIYDDDAMLARISGMTFGEFPLPMALCWQRHDEFAGEMQMHRLHLVLAEAPNFWQRNPIHLAYPGGKANGLVWGYALDGEDRPLWEVRPDQQRWQLQHVHTRGRNIISSKFSAFHRFWALHRVHAYASFGITPSLREPAHLLEAAPANWQTALKPTTRACLHRLRDVRDEQSEPAATGTTAATEAKTSDTEQTVQSDSSCSASSVVGDHWVFNADSRVRKGRQTRTVHLRQIKEEDGAEEVTVGFPSSDYIDESTLVHFNATAAALAEVCACMATPGMALPSFQLFQISHLPYEWPMARLNLEFPSIAASFAQNVSRLAIEETLQGRTITQEWLSATCERLAWRAAGQAAAVIAPLFAYTGAVEDLQRFPAWIYLESQEFWQKAVYTELAGECNELSPMTRSRKSPTVAKRSTTSITSFVIIQRQKQSPNRLPIQSVKVYLPCQLLHTVLSNLQLIRLNGSVLGQDLSHVVNNGDVTLGASRSDQEQQFATMVIKAGTTALPRLFDDTVETPLTRSLFSKGLLDATAAFNVAAAFGYTKVRIELKSATGTQYHNDFDREKEWHEHMPTPWDVMSLNPAQTLTLASQSCGAQVQSADLRETYGNAFVVKDLQKITQECNTLFPQDRKTLTLGRLASIFEEPGFITGNDEQHKLGQDRKWLSASAWRSKIVECGLDPNALTSQVHRPWEEHSADPSARQRERERSRGVPYNKGKSKGKQKRSS
ncbi:MAG: hypothetical protein AAGJ35_02470 [Myxococcota bacterium]